MTVDESGKEGTPKGTGVPFTLPGYAWPSTVAAGFLGVLLFSWFNARGHTHPSEGRFVGPETCRECHEEQFDSWAQTRMANTFRVLLPGEAVEQKLMAELDPERDYSDDPACLPCHTTGYGKVGGFVSFEETPEMAGVTCEACHGHGGTYANSVMDPKDPTFQGSEARDAGLIYPPTETVCRGCHNSASPFVGMGYQFDFAERVGRGTHQHFQLKYEHGR